MNVKVDVFPDGEGRGTLTGSGHQPSTLLPVSVITAARTEGQSIARCLDSVREAGEVYVVDSHSTDNTVEIAESYGAKVVQFRYRGGWPKKRQWALRFVAAFLR